jgi:hypothetical protein
MGKECERPAGMCVVKLAPQPRPEPGVRYKQASCQRTSAYKYDTGRQSFPAVLKINQKMAALADGIGADARFACWRKII